MTLSQWGDEGRRRRRRGSRRHPITLGTQKRAPKIMRTTFSGRKEEKGKGVRGETINKFRVNLHVKEDEDGKGCAQPTQVEGGDEGGEKNVWKRKTGGWKDGTKMLLEEES